MGHQLIFVVETNKQCKSDWIYIKDTIEHFYTFDRTQIKLTVVYLNGKGNYANKEKEIKKLVTQYASTSQTNFSDVIYCVDCDDYDTSQKDIQFLQQIRKYCSDKGHDLVWFCKDVEQVYLGKRIEKAEKKKEAADFKRKKTIKKIQCNKLCMEKYGVGTSNLMRVLDNYLGPHHL